MHESVFAFGVRELTKERVEGKRVLEVGGLNVNGSLQPHIKSLRPEVSLATDIRPGPGVDIVCAAENLELFGFLPFNMIVCVNTLEHVQNWRGAVNGMKDVLAPGGFLLLSAPSPGYPLHEYPHDYWRYTKNDFRKIFSDMEILVCCDDPQIAGAFLLAKKTGARSVDLNEIEVAPVQSAP